MTPDDIRLPTSANQTVAYVSDRLSIAGIIERILSMSGKADIEISTFSTSEEFLRRFYRMRSRGLIGHCRMFCDIRALSKTRTLKLFMSSVFDSVMLCRNHSKMVLIDGTRGSFAVVTSQNQTRGDRLEAGIISSDHFVINQVRAGFGLLSENSTSLDVHSEDYR